MEKILDIAKNVAIVVLALIVAFIIFIGLGKLATYAFSSLASAGASLTSIFVPATGSPATTNTANTSSTTNPGSYSTSTAPTMTATTGTASVGSQTSAPATNAAPGSYSGSGSSGATAQPARTTTYITPRIAYYGLPDLSVSVIATGIVNSAGVFVPQSTAYPGQRVAAEVYVTNVGTNVSGSWILRANLPTNTPGEVFTSNPQQSLAPGDSAKLTLAFNDLINASVSSMIIVVDPYNQIPEANKSNNQATATFIQNMNYNGNYYNSGYNVNYNNNYNAGYGYGYNTNNYCSGYYVNGICNNYLSTNNTYPISYGLPDLVPSILSVNGNGYSYGYSNGLTTATVQITNIGQSIANNYTFTASIGGATQYTSPVEPALAPGQSATYTINLNGGYASGNTMYVTVNPYNSITESNYSNNTVSQSF